MSKAVFILFNDGHQIQDADLVEVTYPSGYGDRTMTVITEHSRYYIPDTEQVKYVAELGESVTKAGATVVRGDGTSGLWAGD